MGAAQVMDLMFSLTFCAVLNASMMPMDPMMDGPQPFWDSGAAEEHAGRPWDILRGGLPRTWKLEPLERLSERNRFVHLHFPTVSKCPSERS